MPSRRLFKLAPHFCFGQLRPTLPCTFPRAHRGGVISIHGPRAAMLNPLPRWEDRLLEKGGQAPRPAKARRVAADQMVVEVPCSSHIPIVTMALDHATLVKSLLACLGRGGLYGADRWKRMQAGASLLRQRCLGHWRAKGARVCVGKGVGRGARLRVKALAVDGRTAFVGSANLTGKALRNAEVVLALTGAVSGRRSPLY